MAYIYKITNDINNKIYIGKTEFSVEKRFKQHCNDSKKEKLKNRPLYAAMRKYGIEHFHIEIIEETTCPEEREQYWIEQLRSFKKGYNATIGGDGAKYIDYDLVISTYLETKNTVKTAQIIVIDRTSVRNILKNNHIEIISSQTVTAMAQKNIGCFDKNDNLIQIFENMHIAARWLQKNNKTSSINTKGIAAHISQVCNNKRKSCYGYIWKFI